MAAGLFFVLTLILAGLLPDRLRLLDGFPRLFAYLAGAAIAQAIGAWIAFGWYLAFGLNKATFAATFFTLALLIVILHHRKAPTVSGSIQTNVPNPGLRRSSLKWTDATLGLFLVVLMPIYWLGLAIKPDGRLLFRFNFIDAAQHLSYSQAFLAKRDFPPLDLNMAGFPLKYHFISDFYLSFLQIGGVDLPMSMIFLNIWSAFLMITVTWAVFRQLLGRAAWLSLLLFFFTNGAFTNLLHWIFINPPYYSAGLIQNPNVAWYAKLHHIVFFPYFNFEDFFLNLFEPQRAFPFALPIAMLLLLLMTRLMENFNRRSLIEVSIVLCLMPFTHIAIFIIFCFYFLIVLFRNRAIWRRWIVPLALMSAVPLAQLYYLKWFGPPLSTSYSGWNAQSTLPLQDFAMLPSWLRLPTFWFFVNGEFLFVGLLGVALILLLRRQTKDSLLFLRRTSGFAFCSIAVFLLINVYKYTINWGDSNKLVLFLNLWCAIYGGLGLVALAKRSRFLGAVLIVFFAGIAVVPWLWNNIDRLKFPPSELFVADDMVAASWIKSFSPSDALFLVSPQHIDHFVPPLTGRTVLAGIYSDVNPYTSRDRFEDIKRIYEEGDIYLASELGVQFIVVGRREISNFRLHSMFQKNRGLVFETQHEGKGIRIYSVSSLLRGSEVENKFHRNPDIRISNLPAIEALDGWGGQCRWNRNGVNKPIRVNGNRMKNAIFAHAPSHLAFHTAGKFIMFRAQIAIEDDGCEAASVLFKIRSGNKVLCESEIVHYKQNPILFECNIENSDKVELVADPTIDGNTCDHALWIEPDFRSKVSVAIEGFSTFHAFLFLGFIQALILFWAVITKRRGRHRKYDENRRLSSGVTFSLRNSKSALLAIKFIGRTIIVVVSILITLIGAEIVFRFFLADEQHTFGASPAYEKSLSRYRLNSAGFRGPAYPKEKEYTKAYRILVLGDSVTFGQGIFDDNNIWPFVMERKLRQKTARRVEVLNFSANGWNTENEYNEYMINGGATWQHDMVLVAYFPNDATWNLAGLDPLLPTRFDFWLSPRSYFYYFLKSRYNALLIQKGQKQGYDLWLRDKYSDDASELPRHWEVLQTLLQSIHKHHADCEVVFIPPLFNLENDFFDEAVLKVRTVVEREHCTFTDIRHEVAEKLKSPESAWLSKYDSHPNKEGHKILGEAIANKIKGKITKQ